MTACVKLVDKWGGCVLVQCQVATAHGLQRKGLHLHEQGCTSGILDLNIVKSGSGARYSRKHHFRRDLWMGYSQSVAVWAQEQRAHLFDM